MKNVVLSTRNIDDFISEVANEVVQKIELSNENRPESSSFKEKLLSVPEAANFLNLSIPTIYSKVSRGELPFMKRSKRLYFSNIELMNYLKKGTKRTNEELDKNADQYLQSQKIQNYEDNRSS